MRLEMVECHIPFSGHCDLELTSFKNNDIQSIYLTLSKVGIPNLVCGCILVWRSAVYHLRVTLNLTSDLVFFLNNLVWSISLILFEGGIPISLCRCRIEWCIPSLGQCDLDLWPSFENCHEFWCISSILFEVGISTVVWVSYTLSGHCERDLDLWPSFKNYIVPSI